MMKSSAYKISTLLVSALALACSNQSDRTDAPPLVSADDGASALTIDESTDTLLVGHVRDGANSAAFRIERSPGRHVFEMHATADGSLILRALIDGEDESLQLGDEPPLAGPRGSVFSAGSSRLQSAFSRARADLALAWKLGPLLSESQDVDPAVFEGLPTLALGASVDVSALDKNHDPTGCAVCHSACAVLEAGCIAATWGVFSFVCIVPAVACHGGCAGSACQ